MNIKKLRENANEVYDILMQECGASGWERKYFLQEVNGNDAFSWYAFSGKLCEGDRLYLSGNRLFVKHPVPGDELSSEHGVMIRSVNSRLRKVGPKFKLLDKAA